MRWYRVDVQDVSIKEVPFIVVRDRAIAAFAQGANDVIKSGRFRTPFAHYAREDRLLDSERNLPNTVDRYRNEYDGSRGF